MENKKNPKTLKDHITIWNIPFHPLFEHIILQFPSQKKKTMLPTQRKTNIYLQVTNTFFSLAPNILDLLIFH
jgi:hypothetical protein